MKKYYLFSGLIILFLLSASMALMPAKTTVKKGTTTEVTKPIPDDLKAVFKASCMACHSSDGKGMPMSILNFSKWDTYKPEKQNKKAAAICKAVSGGSMPPKSFIESNPNAVLTDDQKELICKWSKE